MAVIVDRETVRMLLRLYMGCYKLGVNDAYNYDDCAGALGHLDRTARSGVFGRLGDGVSDTPLYWELLLSRVAADNNIYRAFRRYADKAVSYGTNYLSAGIRAGQCWYNEGVAAYTKFGGNDIVRFNDGWRQLWTEDGLRVITREELIERTQLMLFECLRADMESGGKRALTEKQYMTFIRCLGLGGRL